MLLRIIKTIIGWVKEIWELLKVISDITPQQNQNNWKNANNSKIITNSRENVLHDWQSPEVARHRYIELEGYSDNFRIDRLGRYDIFQLQRFAENFVYVSSDAIDDFVDETVNYKRSIVDGQDVLWVPKGDVIEWSYHQYSALADLL